MLILMQQMKYIFCKRLAACLCMQQSPSVSPEFSIVDFTKTNVGSGNRSNNDNVFKTPEDVSATKNESAGEALLENRDLLEAEIKNDWMLAATVLDRIFAIAFATISIGGTLAFIVIIATYARAMSSGVETGGSGGSLNPGTRAPGAPE